MASNLDNYMNKYDSFTEINIYNFGNGVGGLADCLKFFMFALELCMRDNIRLYYKINNTYIEKYIRLKYDKMYITEEDILKLDCAKNMGPGTYYNSFNFNFSLKINDVFYFTDEVKINRNLLFPIDVTNYISIHLRLGDKFLETEYNYIQCKNDVRTFSEEVLNEFIENYKKRNIFFCCDNKEFKLKLKEKYNNLIITNCDIGHTSLSNTTEKQALDAITEFYILTNSTKIAAASYSGFPIAASKFNGVPVVCLKTT